jgi:hypothetical protein
MKTLIFFSALLSLSLITSLNCFGQISRSGQIEKRLAERSIPNAQLGSLACEDNTGKWTLCSGALDETVLGVVTNVPYITVNKPADPKGSKSIFNAFVSAENGAIKTGDLLVAHRGGMLAKAKDDARFAENYAVALEDFDGGNGQIKVKVIGR